MGKKIRIILIVVIALLIAGMALWPYLSKKEAPGAGAGAPPAQSQGGGRNRALNVNARVAEYETLRDAIVSTGKLIPDEEVNLAFLTSGLMKGIYFTEGAFVRKGQLLAKISDGSLQAEKHKIEAQLPLARERVSRQKMLLENDAVSLEAYQQVTTELEKLEADLELVNVRITHTEIRAPFDGMVGLRQVSLGAYVTPASTIATLTKISPIKLEFSINERYVNQVHDGTVVNFSPTGDSESYRATVYAVESVLDPKTLSQKVRAISPNPGGKLIPGRSVTLSVTLKEVPNAIKIPTEAVVAEMGRDIAYLYKDGKAKAVQVTKGIRTAADIQILSGIGRGDTVIVSGVMQLRDGMAVTLDNVESK